MTRDFSALRRQSHDSGGASSPSTGTAGQSSSGWTDAVSAALREAPVGHTILAVGSVPSTMPIAAAAVEAPGARAGLVVVAEEQTAGRGRFGRRWEAPPGQALLLTIALKPPALPQRMGRLPMLAAVSVLEAICACEPSLSRRVQIKWPNDVLLQVDTAIPSVRTSPQDHAGHAHHGYGKVSGILLESAFVGEEPAYALIGVGINVNQDATAWTAIDTSVLPGGVPPTSLRAGLGRPVDRGALLHHICLCFGANLHAVDAAMVMWRRHLQTLGHPVTVRALADDRVVAGIAEDVDEEGCLVVALADGTRSRFAAGDVTLRTTAG